jgi:hypothetical protein
MAAKDKVVAIDKQGDYPKRGSDLTNGDLEKVCDDYTEYINHWNYMLAAYDGIRAMISMGVGVEQHERESNANYQRRIKELYSFGYSKSVVDLFNFYLFKKDATRKVPAKLGSDELFKLFMQDCNLYGDSFNEFLLEQQRYASAVGHVGILVDKSSQKVDNRAEELKQKIYPYLASYMPQNILWWQYERDANGRPQLVFLKVKDDDGYYRLWWPDGFEVWEEVEDKHGNLAAGQAAKRISSGPNALGEIPWVWLINIKSRNRPIGLSDIEDIAYIDTSIIRNLSQGEEVITYAAFPILTKPKAEAGTSPLVDDAIGPTAVFEFDPEQPDSKPSWMEAKVNEPIDAILKWIGKKVQEIYRASNAGGMAATEISTQAKSGAALKTEFQLLNSKLVSKGTNTEKAEKHIMRLWLKWLNQENLYEQYEVERPKSYEVEDLASDLENAMTANTLVKSKTFIHETMKRVARQMLPSLSEKDMAVIDEEIDGFDPILDPMKAMLDAKSNADTDNPVDDKGNPKKADEEEDEDKSKGVSSKTQKKEAA